MENGPGFRIDSGLWKVLFCFYSAKPWCGALELLLFHLRPRLMEVHHLVCGTSPGHRSRWKERLKNQEWTFYWLSLGKTHVSSSHNLLARASHMRLPNWAGWRKYGGTNRISVSATRPSQLRIQLLEGRCSLHVVLPLSLFVVKQGFKGLHFPGHALDMLWFVKWRV